MTRRRLLAGAPLSALVLAGAVSKLDKPGPTAAAPLVGPTTTAAPAGKSVTVREADAQFALGDWQKWPIPRMPDLPLAPWDGVPGCFWKQPIANAAVDRERTARCRR